MIQLELHTSLTEIKTVTIKRDAFRDGTLKVDNLPDLVIDKQLGSKITLIWKYENDAELFLLYSLVKYYRELDFDTIDLYLPYVPNARQDRPGKGLFTLKYFAEIINSLNFHRVYVFDPHSAATMALLNNARHMQQEQLWAEYKKELASHFDAVMYPDTGAAKRYDATDYDFIGYKHRNTTDDIDQFDLFNFKEGTSSVLIIDDICSSGMTFCEAAKALKEHGVKKVVVAVSHCENAIKKEEVFKYVDKIITTNSIYKDTQDPRFEVVQIIYEGE